MGNKSVRANLVRLALMVACLCSCEIGTKAVDKYYFYRSQMSAYSPVYCWKTPKGQWACGTLSEHYGDVPPERLLSFMQDELPCSLEEMKGLLDEHYEFYGSYIEPNNEFGFGMYEAIREVLCKKPEGGFPVNYAPHEVGLGPYDYPKDTDK